MLTLVLFQEIFMKFPMKTIYANPSFISGNFHEISNENNLC